MVAGPGAGVDPFRAVVERAKRVAGEVALRATRFLAYQPDRLQLV